MATCRLTRTPGGALQIGNDLVVLRYPEGDYDLPTEGPALIHALRDLAPEPGTEFELGGHIVWTS